MWTDYYTSYNFTFDFKATFLRAVAKCSQLNNYVCYKRYSMPFLVPLILLRPAKLATVPHQLQVKLSWPLNVVYYPRFRPAFVCVWDGLGTYSYMHAYHLGSRNMIPSQCRVYPWLCFKSNSILYNTSTAKPSLVAIYCSTWRHFHEAISLECHQHGAWNKPDYFSQKNGLGRKTESWREPENEPKLGHFAIMGNGLSVSV